MLPVPDVSLLVLTHNAPRYVRLTLASLRRTEGVRFEVVVVDNASQGLLPWRLVRWQHRGWIDRLCLLSYNSLFAEGNNIAARAAHQAAPYLLLLNSDVEIRRADWLLRLLEIHREGITAYGVVGGDPIERVDGYSLLIDTALYRRYQLDEGFQWYWAVTKLQAQVLTAGYAVRGVRAHDAYLHHFGGKSGSVKGARGMGIAPEEVIGWFQGRAITVQQTV